MYKPFDGLGALTPKLSAKVLPGAMTVFEWSLLQPGGGWRQDFLRRLRLGRNTQSSPLEYGGYIHHSGDVSCVEDKNSTNQEHNNKGTLLSQLLQEAAATTSSVSTSP